MSVSRCLSLCPFHLSLSLSIRLVFQPMQLLCTSLCIYPVSLSLCCLSVLYHSLCQSTCYAKCIHLLKKLLQLMRACLRFLPFFQGYVSTAKGKIRQMKKDPRRGCYMFVPASLAWTPPNHARQRLAALLVSAFAKTNGLSILLAQAALAVSRHRQPEVMHIIVGAGADGKSMVCVELMRACFGTAFSNPACTVLQAHTRLRACTTCI